MRIVVYRKHLKYFSFLKICDISCLNNIISKITDIFFIIKYILRRNIMDVFSTLKQNIMVLT